VRSLKIVKEKVTMMIARTERVLSACGLALAVLGCATAAAVAHIDGSRISSIVITGAIAAGAVVLFTSNNVAEAIGLFATGVAAVVCETVAVCMHVQADLATNIGRLGVAVTVVVGILALGVRLLDDSAAHRRRHGRGARPAGPQPPEA
jgi:hypothetical protein